MKLELELEEIDYSALAERLAALTERPEVTEALRASGNPVALLLSGGLSAKLAAKILAGLSEEQKEALIVDLINGSSKKLCSMADQAAASRGVSIRCSRIHAEKS